MATKRKAGEYFAEPYSEPDENGVLGYAVYKVVDSMPDDDGKVTQHRIWVAGGLSADQAEALVEACNA